MSANKTRTFPEAATVLQVVILILILGLAIKVVPGLMKARTSHSTNACRNTLRQIQEAKEQWMIAHKKSASDTPAWADLVGTDKYIKVMPSCPSQGAYVIGSLAVKSACSLKGDCLCHNLEGKPCGGGR